MKWLIACLLAGCSAAPPMMVPADLAIAETPDMAMQQPTPDMVTPPVMLDPTPGKYVGTCDGSGGAALDAVHFLDLNDEEQQVRVYTRGMNTAASQSLDLTAGLGLTAGDEADFEDAARVGNRIYVTSSHGRDKNGKLAPARHRLFALDVNALGVVGYSSTLLADVLDATRWTKPDNAVIALLQNASKLGTNTDPDLAPEVNGVNIEGLAQLPPNRLVIGFRNPLSAGKTILVTLLNADAMLTGARAQIGEAFVLDLGGAGVRSMVWSDTHHALLILAGLRIYKWDGVGQPVMAATLTAAADTAPEALIAYPNTLDVQVLFDQGDLMIGGDTCKKAAAGQRYFFDRIVHVP
jgi:hypothetical protein